MTTDLQISAALRRLVGAGITPAAVAAAQAQSSAPEALLAWVRLLQERGASVTSRQLTRFLETGALWRHRVRKGAVGRLGDLLTRTEQPPPLRWTWARSTSWCRPSPIEQATASPPSPAVPIASFEERAQYWASLATIGEPHQPEPVPSTSNSQPATH